MNNNTAAKTLRIVSTLFLPLSITTVSLFGVAGYGMVWIGSSGDKKRYYKAAAVLYFIGSVFSLLKLYLITHTVIMEQSFAYGWFGRTPIIAFGAATALIMAGQGILSAFAAKNSSDNSSFF